MPVGNESVKRRYLQVKDGKIAEYKGETTWNSYNHVSRVHLVNITFRKVHKVNGDTNSDVIGNMLQLHLVDQNDYFVFEVWYDSSYAKCFYNVMENLSLLEELSLFTDEKLIEGKKRQSLFIKQSAGWVKHKYTKDNMGNCPNMQFEMINDKKVWNDDLQMLFYLDQVEKQIIPKLERKLNPFPNHLIFDGIVKGRIAGNHFTTNDTPALPSIDAVDDLPF